MRKEPKDNHWILVTALVASLCLHLPLWDSLSEWLSSPPEIKEQQSHPLIARMVRKEPKKRIVPPSPPVDKGVVVRLPEPEKKTPPPKDAKALAKDNHRVEKEMKTRDRSPSRKPPRKGIAKVNKESELQSRKSPSKKPTRMKEPKEAKRNKPVPKNVPLADVGSIPKSSPSRLPPHPSLLLPATNQKFAMANIQTQSLRTMSDDALLYVEDEGAQTMLNAREFRYWQFFDRVKSKVRDNWSPGREYRRRDPTGRLYGVADRYTLLRVTLNPSGDIERIGVVKKAGADFLDEEAWRAFRAAGPFPNPPKGLVGEDGRITFEFGFLFEISSGPKFFWKR